MKHLAAIFSPSHLPKASIPNQIGFRFLGVYADGSTKPLEVLRHADGGHTIGAEWSQIVGWRRMPTGEGAK